MGNKDYRYEGPLIFLLYQCYRVGGPPGVTRLDILHHRFRVEGLLGSRGLEGLEGLGCRVRL